MTWSLGDFYQYYSIEEQKILVDKFGTTEKKELNKLMKKYILSKTETTSKLAPDLDNEYKQARIKNLGYKNRIDSIRASQYEKYNETFQGSPSPQAEKAIKEYATRDLTNTEKENVTKYLTIQKTTDYKWKVKCDICKEGETYDTYHELLNDMVRHLTTEHKKQVMYV